MIDSNRQSVLPVPGQQKGKVILASTLQSHADAINEMRGVKGPRINHFGLPASSPGGAMIALSFVSQSDNYITCQYVMADGSLGETIEVAKPSSLRVIAWSGKTLNGVTYTKITSSERSAFKSPNTEIQVITPAYFVGMPTLRALPVVDSNGANSDYVLGSNGEPLIYEQVTAQEWAEKFTE